MMSAERPDDVVLPAALAQICVDFHELEIRERLQLLLEFSNELPVLPARYSEHPDLLERVEECQSPVFIFVEVDEHQIVHLFATAPKEAPTTRGFASILVQGLVEPSSGSNTSRYLPRGCCAGIW